MNECLKQAIALTWNQACDPERTGLHNHMPYFGFMFRIQLLTDKLLETLVLLMFSLYCELLYIEESDCRQYHLHSVVLSIL